MGHVQEGKTIDYPNSSGSDIAAGDVVVAGVRVGVAMADIVDGTTGAIAVEEVFGLPKAAEALTIGALVYWDADGDPVDGTAGTGAMTATSTDNTLAGYVTEAAASGDALVNVKLNA